MSGQGIGQILVYAVVLVALALSARPLHGAGLRDRAVGVPLARGGRARLLPARPHRPDARAGLEELREDRARLQRRLLGRPLRDPAAAGHLFLNPDHLKGVPSHIALNTTASFVTNTNWQFYGGEYTMSYLTQMAGLAVQNFVSAAVGMAVLAAVVRGHRAPLDRGARQLLGRPLPLARLHPAAARR